LSQLLRGSEALPKAYDKALERIDDQLEGFRHLARRVLTWITYAKRELSVSELRVAISIHPEMQRLDFENDLEDEEEMVSVCAGLVIVDNKSRVVRLVHYTTQEYLERVRKTWLPDGETEIARNCVAYLAMEIPVREVSNSINSFGSEVQELPRSGFFFYTAQYWAWHFAEAGDSVKPDTEQQALKLCTEFCFEGTARLTFRLVDHLQSKSDDRILPSSKLSIASILGLTRLVSSFIADGCGVNATDGNGYTPLYYAVREGCNDVVKTLISKGSDITLQDFGGMTALHVAAENVHESVLELLLEQSVEHNTDKDVKDFGDETALCKAASRGLTSNVRILIQSGCNTEAKNNEGMTPLAVAASLGHVESVLTLLEHGADINSTDLFGWTPLSWAIVGGYEDIVRLLIRDRVVNFGQGSAARSQPLWWANVFDFRRLPNVLNSHANTMRPRHLVNPPEILIGPRTSALCHDAYTLVRVQGKTVKARISTGNGMTFISESYARICGILSLVDRKWAGVAQHHDGIHKAAVPINIIGRIHCVQFQLGPSNLMISVTVLSRFPFDFILGLDILRRYQLSLDFGKQQITPPTGEAIPLL
jgi:ankyrin repeat protein